jgi:DNA-binding NarL/FixJ family response regulator
LVAAGARGYVLKDDVPAAVLEALSAARQGQARLSAAVTGPVMEDRRELHEAAVSRSKELEAENADLSSDRRVEPQLPERARSLQATPRRCGWWSATWSTTPASTPRPAPRSGSWSASHGA